MPILPELIGERIRYFREDRDPRITQEELAARMQARGHDTITRQRIQDIEHGRRTVRPEELVSFARSFGVTITQLLGVPDYSIE